MSSLPDGTITLSVTLTDSSSNIGSATTDTKEKETVVPVGYSVSIDGGGPITASDVSSIGFTFAGAEVGTTYIYTFTSSAGGTPVTATGTIVSSGQSFSSIDLSGLADGTITLSVTLTDNSGNIGSAATDTATKDILPYVIEVTSDASNGTFKIGDAINIYVQYDQEVVVTGTPQLILETGTTDRTIDYVDRSFSTLRLSLIHI